MAILEGDVARVLVECSVVGNCDNGRFDRACKLSRRISEILLRHESRSMTCLTENKVGRHCRSGARSDCTVEIVHFLFLIFRLFFLLRTPLSVKGIF